MVLANVALEGPLCNPPTIANTYPNLIKWHLSYIKGIFSKIVGVLNFYPRFLQRPSTNGPLENITNTILSKHSYLISTMLFSCNFEMARHMINALDRLFHSFSFAAASNVKSLGAVLNTFFSCFWTSLAEPLQTLLLSFDPHNVESSSHTHCFNQVILKINHRSCCTWMLTTPHPCYITCQGF